MYFLVGRDRGKNENRRDSISDGRNSISTRQQKVQGIHGATGSGRPWVRRAARKSEAG